MFAPVYFKLLPLFHFFCFIFVFYRFDSFMNVDEMSMKRLYFVFCNIKISWKKLCAVHVILFIQFPSSNFDSNLNNL